MPRRVAVLGQHLPAAAKVFPVEFHGQQAAAERQQRIPILIVEDFAPAIYFALLNGELQAPLAAGTTQRGYGQPRLGVAVQEPEARSVKPSARMERAVKPPGDVLKRVVPMPTAGARQSGNCQRKEAGDHNHADDEALHRAVPYRSFKFQITSKL